MNSNQAAELKRHLGLVGRTRPELPFLYSPAGPEGLPIILIKTALPPTEVMGFLNLVKSKELVRGNVKRSDNDGALTFDIVSGDGMKLAIDLNGYLGEVIPALKWCQVTGLFDLEGPQDDAPAETDGSKEALYQPLKAALTDVTTDNRYWFWFAMKTKGRAPNLVLMDARKDKKGVAYNKWKQTAPKAKGVLEGKVSVSDDLKFIFRAEDPFPNFISILASWTKAKMTHCSQLSALKNARFIQKDSDGVVQDRQKDDGAWSFID